jgi:hypothetical protein
MREQLAQRDGFGCVAKNRFALVVVAQQDSSGIQLGQDLSDRVIEGQETSLDALHAGHGRGDLDDQYPEQAKDMTCKEEGCASATS